ncbi:hypothetical protein AMJ85_05545 [candidate division BRC1 bacterium SM23_51]|nr:MAG: hypothetical protein AMJ85_05545 [candidate division BRC1 bacterium SM23_51]
MLEVVDYRVDGLKLRVRLKCTCGGRRVVKSKKGDETHYECASCKAWATMRQLKSAATPYWQGRAWEIECEKPKKALERIHVNYPARLVAQAHRSAPPYCTLTGRCGELGPSGLLFVAEDFKTDYFDAMSSEHCHAEVQFAKLVHGLPTTLRGSIVEIKFREEELPVCHIRIAFKDLSETEEKQIVAHVEDLRGRITEWSAE